VNAATERMKAKLEDTKIQIVEQKRLFPVTDWFLHHRNKSTKLLWYCKVTDRWGFKNIIRCIYNEPTLVNRKKLKTTKSSLMGLKLGMNHLYRAFVKDTQFFLSATGNTPPEICFERLLAFAKKLRDREFDGTQFWRQKDYLF